MEIKLCELPETYYSVASEEIKFVIVEYKNDMLFALHIITAANVDVENVSCQK